MPEDRNLDYRTRRPHIFRSGAVPSFAPEDGNSAVMPTTYGTETDTRCSPLGRSQDQGTDQHMCSGENPVAVFDRMRWQSQPHRAHSHTRVTATTTYAASTDSKTTDTADTNDTSQHSVRNPKRQDTDKHYDPRTTQSATRMGWIHASLARTLHAWIAWTSGEAYHPGPLPARKQQTKSPKSPRRRSTAAHVGDVAYRFHNVQGLSDRKFRDYYLAEARRQCDVLALAETNCGTEEEAREWSRGWKKASHTFWSLAPSREGKRGGSHRGMAILLADTLGKTDAREIYNDPQGRVLAVSACIHNRPTIIVAYHAETHSDDEQRDGFLALKAALPHDPTCDYIWLMDRNNVPDETLDYKSAKGEPNSTQRPLGIAAMHDCTTHWGGMRDAYRALYPRRRQFTRQYAPHG